MSVLVPDLKVFYAIEDKINTYKWRGQVDENFSSYFREHFQTEKKTREFMKSILLLNELSWIEAYGKENEKPSLDKFYNNSRGLVKSICTVQFLKYLHCIEYNIEIKSITQDKNGKENRPLSEELKQAHEHLTKGIGDIQYMIATKMTDYNDLKYCDI